MIFKYILISNTQIKYKDNKGFEVWDNNSQNDIDTR